MVSQLVQQGRWEFVGGGYVQHDEALNDPHMIMDQMTLGAAYLYTALNVTPQVSVGSLLVIYHAATMAFVAIIITTKHQSITA